MAYLNNLRLVFEEQPARFLRFRYESEGRVCTIFGKSGTKRHPTYVTIKLTGSIGNEIILVRLSLVTENHFPHPHKLADINRTNPDTIRFHRGIYENHINRATNKLVFLNLGMQCVKKNFLDITESLRIRDECRVRPFGNRSYGSVNRDSFDLNIVKICVEGFIVLPDKSMRLFDTIVSEPIIDAKSVPDLRIVRLSHASADANERVEITLLCEKIYKKEDIIVEFMDPNTGWRGTGKIVTVHKHVAVVVNTPAYNGGEPGLVNIRLRMPELEREGSPVPFRFTPSETEYRYRKRFKPFDFNELFPEMNQGSCMELDLSNMPPILQYPLPQNEHSVQLSYPVNDDHASLSKELEKLFALYEKEPISQSNADESQLDLDQLFPKTNQGSSSIQLSDQYSIPESEYSFQQPYPVNDDIASLLQPFEMLPYFPPNISTMPYDKEASTSQPDTAESNNGNLSESPNRELNSEEMVVQINENLPDEIMSSLIYNPSV